MANCLRIGIDARILEEDAPMGVSRFMAALLQATAEIAPQHEYLLFMRRPSFSEPAFTRPPFFARTLSANLLLTNPLCWQQIYLPWKAWRERVDVLFSPYYCGPLLAPMAQVVCISDISFALFPQDFSSWIHFKPKLLARPSSKRAEKVMTISEFSRQELVRVYGLAPEKVVAIHAGAEERFWPRSRQKQPNVATVTPPEPFFLFVGSLFPRRQVFVVLQALAQLPEQYRLVVVGENDARKLTALRETARQADVETRLLCLGHVSDEDLASLYSRAVALVSPSTYEGFGLPVLEAMMRGTPVIAWDIPVVREVVDEAAILLPIGDVPQLTAMMLRLGEDKSWRQTLSESGKRQARQFSWFNAAQLFLDMIKEATRG